MAQEDTELQVKEVVEAIKDLKSDLSKTIDEKTKGIADKASLQDLAAIDEKIKTLTSVGEQLTEDFKALQLRQNEKELKTKEVGLRAVFVKSFEDNKGKIGQVEGRMGERFKAAEIITTGNVGDGVVIGLREPGINAAPYRQRFVTDLINTANGGVGSDPLTWVEWRPGSGAPTLVAENTTKPAMDWTYAEGKTTASTIAIAPSFTKQAVRSMQAIGENYQNEVLPALYDELDRQVLLGNGTSELKGIINYCQPFTGSSLAGAIEEVNAFDVIRAAILQVRKGNMAAAGYSNRTGYIPSAILVSPDTMAQFDLTKNSLGNYILPPFTATDGTVIKGIKVIENDFVAADQFIVGDFSKVLLNFVEGVTAQIGWVNAQFINNAFTFLAEVVASVRVKYHDQWAFTQGTFTAAKTLLAPAS